MLSAADVVYRYPNTAFILFAALHIAVWTALPASLFANPPPDLIEALVYGREWQLGYLKSPPLPYWLAEVVQRLFGLDLFFYALVQVAIVGGFAGVWLLAKWIAGPVAALVSVLILDGLHYFHFTAASFDAGAIQLPFWTLAGLSFWAALRGGKIEHWLLLGIALGGALWTNYFVAALALPLLLFLAIDRAARRTLMTPGPYVALAVALAVAAPHLVWLAQYDLAPLQYLNARALPWRGQLDHLVRPLEFAAGQIAFILPALAVALPLFYPRGGTRVPHGEAPDRRIVALLTFGPAVTVAALSLITGRGIPATWAAPLWLVLGLWLVTVAASTLQRARLGRILASWAVIFLLFAAAFVAVYAVQPGTGQRDIAVFFPGERLGTEMSARFRALTGRPLAYVIGSVWSGGNIAHYAPERPRVLIEGSPRRAPWIDLADLRARGALVVWLDGDPRVLPVAYRSIAEDAEIQEPFALTYRRGEGSVLVSWAVLRPRPAVAFASPR
jgi:4-amino-4-deoxy-L-arabinose transferase-like glycosyltransferase